MSDKSLAPVNRLIQATSPYLLQHAHNPVDWYEWGSEAIARARSEDKLILLSIGYAACHWCHVMERESFENEDIAALMNENFINIKVDREERPDLDDIYMAATIAMNQGQGGWPMTVFLTPALEPVFAGTYFPPDDLHGRPGFRRLLTEMARAWRDERERLRSRATDVTELLRAQRALAPSLGVGLEQLDLAARQFEQNFDRTHGGFGPAPKFPPAVGLMLLLRLQRRFGRDDILPMVTKTLDGMAQGGIYDHVGGGFARYSTDETWLVPHFEKMLYDNALLARVYLEAFQVTAHVRYERVARETFDYILKEMTAPQGGFYSSTDADSEGVEGKFFVWQPDEIREILGDEDAHIFNTYYDITEGGNWEGRSIPHVTESIEQFASRFSIDASTLAHRLRDMREKVYAARSERVPPGLDDKILTAWNGLMIGSFAEGYRVLREDRYLDAATRAADFVLGALTTDDDRLLRTCRKGKAHTLGFLEDYGFFAEALIDLYEVSGESKYMDWARRITNRMLEDFGDGTHGAFYHTSPLHEDLVLRFRDGHDGAIPSPNAAAAAVLARLSYHLANSSYRERAIGAIEAYGSLIAKHPRGFAKSLIVVDLLLEGPTELAFIAGETPADLEPLFVETAKHFLPNRIQAIGLSPGDGEGMPLLQGKGPVDGKAAIYVCRDFTCQRPTTDPHQFRRAIEGVTSHELDRKTVTVRRSGAATSEATASYAKRHDTHGYAVLYDTGLRASRVGFGAYRTSDQSPDHRRVLAAAVKSGINLIDTSTNYDDGGSERLIGRVLSELQGSGVERNEIIVVSKIGYVQGENHELVKTREARGDPFPEMVKVTDELWHCMHPTFLEDQLHRSLDRLGLATLDICLVHNPEYYLAYAAASGVPTEEAQNVFYGRLEAAFGFFERCIDAGLVSWYGVSSNTVAYPSGDPEQTSLTRMLDAARSAGGEGHRFRFLQLPLNLFESSAVFEPKEGPTGDQTVLRYAATKGVSVLVNRPLNAIVSDRMVRLADCTVEGEPIDLPEQVEKVQGIERTFRTGLANDVPAVSGAPSASEFFRWGEKLAGLDVSLLGIDHWRHIERQVRSSLESIAIVYNRRLTGDVATRWSTWHSTYVAEVNRLLGEFGRQVHATASAQAHGIASALNEALPERRIGESLARKALWVAASTPGVQCVLNGMRTTDYVDDAVAVISWERLERAEDLYHKARGGLA